LIENHPLKRPAPASNFLSVIADNVVAHAVESLFHGDPSSLGEQILSLVASSDHGLAGGAVSRWEIFGSRPSESRIRQESVHHEN
jgi:hypothetical protein